MTIDITEKLRELVLEISDTRGVENVRIVHSVLVECCHYLSKQIGQDILPQMMALIEAPYDENNWEGRTFIYKMIAYKLRTNIFYEIDGPDSLLIMQEELPGGIDEILSMDGLTEWERYDIFSRGVQNVDINRLPKIYQRNAHVIHEGYAIQEN